MIGRSCGSKGGPDEGRGEGAEARAGEGVTSCLHLSTRPKHVWIQFRMLCLFLQFRNILVRFYILYIMMVVHELL